MKGLSLEHSRTSRIVVELTNRCNLSCHHCFDGRHGGEGEIKIEIVEEVLNSARSHGINYISFTGGEPTLHNGFIDILRITSEAGYKFGFVTNGWNFVEIYEKLLQFHKKLTFITFSLDGVSEETHDRIRGKGSYRKVMQAVSICVVKDIPFAFNSVISSYNHKETGELVELAHKLGSHGIKFGYLMPTSQSTEDEIVLSPEGQRDAETAIYRIQKNAQIPVTTSSGFYTDELYPCTPLKALECNVDWKGNVTMCCNLSGHGNNTGNGDVICNLDEMSFSEAHERFVKFNKQFCNEKLNRHNKENLRDSDYFPCWYCFNYFDKVGWMKNFPQNSWSSLVWDRKIE